jgi:hypothetical protein
LIGISKWVARSRAGSWSADISEVSKSIPRFTRV